MTAFRGRRPRWWLLLLLIGIVIVAGAAGATATRSPSRERWACVLVRPGDTLWEVAKRVSGDDPRRVVDTIVRRNGLKGGLITPGTALWVPAADPRYAGQSSECGFGAAPTRKTAVKLHP